VACERNIIANNFCWGDQFEQIKVSGYGGARPQQNVIVGNIVNGDGRGIMVHYANRTIVIGNYIVGTVKHSGIRVIGESAINEGCIVKGNFVQTSRYHGIHIELMRNVVVEGNVVKNNNQEGTTYNGIHIKDSTYVIVRGNKCYDDQVTKTQQYGIYEDGTSDYNIIEDNDVRENAVGGISYIGAATKVRRNVGYVTENSGVAIFSGDGTTTTFNIPHGLAAAPSKYGVSPLTPDADAARTVTVNATNIVVTYTTGPP